MTHSTSEYGPLWASLTDASRTELRELADATPPLAPTSAGLVADLEGASVLFVGSAWFLDTETTPVVGVVASGFLEWIRANPDN